MSFTVWTTSTNEEMIRRNTGISDFIVCSNIPYRQSAEGLVNRLRELYGDENAWIEEY